MAGNHCKPAVALAAIATAALAASAANLIGNGDFSGDEKAFNAVVRRNTGKVSFIREDASWNGCGKLEVDRSYTNNAGHVIHQASVWIGVSEKGEGFAVKPGRRYKYSMELKGTTHRAVARYLEWKKGESQPRCPEPPLFIAETQKDWKRYQGAFTISKDADRAALCIQMWSSTEYNGKQHKIGEAVFFDNVTVEESAADPALLAGGETSEKEPKRKAVADGVMFDDFLELKQGVGAVDKSPVPVKARINAGIEGFIVKAVVEGYVEGEELEVHFGPAKECQSRSFTQFVWDLKGTKKKYVSGLNTDADFKVVKNEVKDGKWMTSAVLPYAALGCTHKPAAGEGIGFNLSITSPKRGWTCFSPVTTSFSDVKNFATFYCGTYAEALKAQFGVDEKVSGRAAFEERVSDLKTAARQERINRF